ncbi:hypothetical protein WMF38_26785 [Sorangium sp. So ce118]
MAREPGTFPLEAIGSGQSTNPTIERVQLILPLTHRTLDHIERLRSVHRKGDVVLHCDTHVISLVSTTVNAHFMMVPVENQRDIFSVFYRHQQSFQPNTGHTNMWVLSGDNGRCFAQREVHKDTRDAIIVSSDWLHDYAGPWKSTSYFVFEVPHQEVIPGGVGLQEWINAAIAAVQSSTESLAKGDWNGVVEDLRPVWELFKTRADVRNLLESDGYSPEAASALNDSVKAQFELASKFVHRVDKSGKKVTPDIRASREDAYLVYAFATAVVNLLAAKLSRAQRT